MHPETSERTTARRARLDVIQAQLAAIDSWHETRRMTEAARERAATTREERMDLSRRMEARRREHEALIARADAHLKESCEILGARDAVRAVIAHRNAWVRDKVSARLTERGVIVVGAFEDGADAAGAMVVEQAELLLVEDRLPTLLGEEVVRRVRSFSPATVVGAHVLDSSGVSPLADAGAHAVFTRRIPPVDIADQLLGCLEGDRRLLALV